MPLTGPDGRERKRFEEGRVVVDGLWPREGMDQLRLELEAAGYEAYSQAGITLAEEDDLDLGTLRLVPMPLVRVTVLDDVSGDPVEGARVTLRAKQQGGGRGFRMRMEAGDHDEGGDHITAVEDSLHMGRTDSQGVCELSSFPGREATLLVRADDFAPAREEALQLPAKGDVEREVRLVLGGSVVITVVDGAGEPAPGAKVEHDKPGGAGGSHFGGGGELTSDERGLVRVSHLEPGVHAFRVQNENPATGGFFFSMNMPGEVGRQGTGWEEITVAGEELFGVVKKLINETAVRRIIIKNESRRIHFEIPLLLGVAGIALLPVYAALAMIAALVADCTILVERAEPKEEAAAE